MLAMKTLILDTSKFSGWPSKDRKPVVEIASTPDKLSHLYGLKFIREKDDLDWEEATHFIDEMLGPVVFSWYENSPSKGVVLYVDSLVKTTFAIERLKEKLGLSESEIIWTAK